MTLAKYKKAVDRTGEAQLTFVNKQGDSFFAGNADRVVHLSNEKLKFRWKISKQQDWYKFTHALLHVGQKIYLAYDISDVTIVPETGKVEFVFDT